MTSFELKDISIETLTKIIDASFPDLNYKINGTDIVFDELKSDNLSKIEVLIKICRFSARFSKKNMASVPEVNIDDDYYRMAPSSDVNQLLELNGELVWAGDGLATLSGDFLKLKKSLERYWLMVAENINAIEIENAALWSVDITNQAKYLDDFPHEAALVIGCKKNHDSVEKINNIFKKGLTNNADDLAGVLSEFQVLGMCQPSVCTSCYHALGAKKINSNGIYTTYNRVFRNEGRRSLDRLLSFTVRDLIAVGEEGFVRNWRSNFFGLADKFIEDLDLPISIEQATDPFFASAAEKLIVQQSAELKHELLIDIPQTGNRIAIGSINLHLNVFGKRFDIYSNEKNVFSCCMGIGFERTAYAFMSYYGLDFKYWPEKQRKLLML
jgi:hypothetical protein